MDLPCTCFRPLSGSYISQLNLLSQPATLLNVSVPYRGATFLNDNSTIQGLMDTSFPSPIGELHFSILYYWYWKHPRSIVSVPYRGATFLNAFITHIAIMMMVSVPYRGATFLNCGMNATIIYYNGFPSPIGELHFSIEFGIMDEWIRYVSVPYRGATFLNCTACVTSSCYPSFRPLSGSYISQWDLSYLIGSKK